MATPEANELQVSNTPVEGYDPLDLTLGVEIECIILQDSRLFDNDHYELARREICKVLSKELNFRCSACNEQRRFRPFFDCVAKEPKEADHTSWSVTEDESVSIADMMQKFFNTEDTYIGHGFEIVSRVLSYNQPLEVQDIARPCIDSSWHQLTYQEEIQAVVRALVDHFDNTTEMKGWQIIVNESCGFHLHVGNQEKGFPLHTVKNVASLYTANEMALDSMHALDRVDGSPLHIDGTRGDFCTPFMNSSLYETYKAYNLSCSSIFANLKYGLGRDESKTYRNDYRYPENMYETRPELLTAVQTNTLQSRLSIINNALDLLSLDSLQDQRETTLNLENLKPYNPSAAAAGPATKSTFEFRQHAGTLDTMEIFAFIDVHMRLVAYAHSHTLTQIHQQCQKVWRDPTWHLFHFLDMLGFDKTHETFKHYKLVTGLRKRDESQIWADVYLERGIARFGGLIIA